MDKIVSVSITYPPMDKATVTATFESGEVAEVLRFYADELRFTEREFVGLTREGVGDLFHQKDVAYLRS